MTTIKNLENVFKEEQKKFIDSFDHLLMDIDGVIWLNYIQIPGAAECLSTLKSIGKKVRYITNNSGIGIDTLIEYLSKNSISVDKDDIVNPIVTIVDYFKKINFKKEIYTFSNPSIREELIKAGFKVVFDTPCYTEEPYFTLINKTEINQSVGAVLMDLDLMMNYIKLQKAVWYLQQTDCQFIAGFSDKLIPIGSKGPLLGTWYFIEALKEASGKTPTYLAKPSQYFCSYIKKKWEISDSTKALVIGDSIESDMMLAAKGGFNKLLVLSGLATKEDLENWKHSEEYKPEYYVQDLKTLNRIINEIYAA